MAENAFFKQVEEVAVAIGNPFLQQTPGLLDRLRGFKPFTQIRV